MEKAHTTDNDQLLASVALLSLSYITRKTLEEDEKAHDFFDQWIKNAKLPLGMSSDDIPALIKFAKLGENQLQALLEAQPNSNT